MRIDELKKILELAEIQETALLRDNVEDYIELLNDREVILEQIDQKTPLNEEEKKTIIDIQEIDSRNRERLETERDKVKGELKKLREGKKTSKNYAGSYLNPYEANLSIGQHFDTK